MTQMVRWHITMQSDDEARRHMHTGTGRKTRVGTHPKGSANRSGAVQKGSLKVLSAILPALQQTKGQLRGRPTCACACAAS